MVRRKIGSTLAACGIVMLLFGMSALPALGAAPASVHMAPSPRPALASAKGSSDTVLMGHITGTVIDLTSGAPSAGVAVRVGGALVWSDANGNYDHWLPVGTYTVTVVLLAGGLVGFGPVLGGRSPGLVLRTHAANSMLLRRLLSAPAQSARPATPRAAQSSDDLLAVLLTTDAYKQDGDRRV